MLLLSQIYTLKPKFTITEKQDKEIFIREKKNKEKQTNKTPLKPKKPMGRRDPV